MTGKTVGFVGLGILGLPMAKNLLEAVVSATSGGAAGCWTLDDRAPRMIRGSFEPGFDASYQYKDLRIATGAGETVGAPMPLTELAHEIYKSMDANGLGRDDNSGVMQSSSSSPGAMGGGDPSCGSPVAVSPVSHLIPTGESINNRGSQ